MRKFNTTGPCFPARHYMVDITSRLEQIRAMVADGDYFAINRGRQYGKTTTIMALERYLAGEYRVIRLDFQALDDDSFQSGAAFARAFSKMMIQRNDLGVLAMPGQAREDLKRIASGDGGLPDVFMAFARWCLHSDLPVVLIVDEVDSASNNQVFLDFLAQLRLQYIEREGNPSYPAFQSVILAGVTDVRHLRAKIRDESQHKVNSPWNIAVDYRVDMAFSAADIAGMLEQYEAEHATGMDVASVAAQLSDYTGGYPFLVSRICQILDEVLDRNWSVAGVDEAVRLLLSENNALFDSLMGKLTNYPELNRQLRAVLLRGESIAWLPDDEEQRQLAMYGFVRNDHNKMVIANKVFEMRLYVQYVGKGEKNEPLRVAASAERSRFVDEAGGLNVPEIMRGFIQAHALIHGDDDQRFLEQEGRERFLTYLSPIINGTGTYDIEPQTRDGRRMDVVVHWLGRRYVIELKLWRGERYNENAEQQILGYLDHFDLEVGYLLSFDFRKRKEPGVKRIMLGNRVLFEGTV